MITTTEFLSAAAAAAPAPVQLPDGPVVVSLPPAVARTLGSYARHKGADEVADAIEAAPTAWNGRAGSNRTRVTFPRVAVAIAAGDLAELIGSPAPSRRALRAAITKVTRGGLTGSAGVV